MPHHTVIRLVSSAAVPRRVQEVRGVAWQKNKAGKTLAESIEGWNSMPSTKDALALTKSQPAVKCLTKFESANDRYLKAHAVIEEMIRVYYGDGEKCFGMQGDLWRFVLDSGGLSDLDSVGLSESRNRSFHALLVTMVVQAAYDTPSRGVLKPRPDLIKLLSVSYLGSTLV